MNRSFWSFCTRDDIRCSFNHGNKNTNDKKTDVPEKFIDAFEDFPDHINFLPPRVPVTIVWNWHLPRFDLTREDQEYKAFAELPLDLPFRYGSLTVMRTSFRPWIGSDSMPTFAVPGLEFVAITGEDIFISEWRNPAGTWFRQIIPTGTQLIHLMQEIQNQFFTINDQVPDYDYEDNSLEGHITLSEKVSTLLPHT